MVGSPVLGPWDAAAQIPEWVAWLNSSMCEDNTGGFAVCRVWASAKQSCDSRCARVGIKGGSDSSRLKDSEKLVSVQWKMLRTVTRTEAMSYEQWLKELCLAWRRNSGRT